MEIMRWLFMNMNPTRMFERTEMVNGKSVTWPYYAARHAFQFAHQTLKKQMETRIMQLQ